jgi:hypothetical protein
MRGTLTIAGVIGILVLAAPASAEDYYVGAPGVDVGIGSGYHHYRDRDRGDHYRTEGFDRSYGERCRLTVIRHSDGTTTRERRCHD